MLDNPYAWLPTFKSLLWIRFLGEAALMVNFSVEKTICSYFVYLHTSYYVIWLVVIVCIIKTYLWILMSVFSLINFHSNAIHTNLKIYKWYKKWKCNFFEIWLFFLSYYICWKNIFLSVDNILSSLPWIMVVIMIQHKTKSQKPQNITLQQ